MLLDFDWAFSFANEKKGIVPLNICGVPLCVSLRIHRLIKFIAEVRLTWIAFTINSIKNNLDDFFWHFHPIQKFQMDRCGCNHEHELLSKYFLSQISQTRKACDKQLGATAINKHDKFEELVRKSTNTFDIVMIIIICM